MMRRQYGSRCLFHQHRSIGIDISSSKTKSLGKIVLSNRSKGCLSLSFKTTPKPVLHLQRCFFSSTIEGPPSNVDEAADPQNTTTDNINNEIGEEEILSVEILDGSSDEFPSSSLSSSSSSSTAETILPYTDIGEIDAFSRAKVLNFIKKKIQEGSETPSSTYSSSANDFFEIREVKDAEGETKYVARLPLPLPVEEYGQRVGEGIAESKKDAEGLAAMHAERVIDSLGIPLCSLQSTQRRHAENAKKNGRWAPLPGDAAKDPKTPSPAPLRKVGTKGRGTSLSSGSTSSRNANYTVCCDGAAFSPLALTLFSPSYLDSGSVKRIQRLYDNMGRNIKKFSRLTRLPSLHADDKDEFLFEINLIVPPEYGARIAAGKAPHRRTATILACMHAELLIDALGLPLYPYHPNQQRQHAEECATLGRWATQPDEKHPDKVLLSSPLALRLGSLHEIGKPQSKIEEEMRAHREAVDGFTNLISISFLDTEAHCTFSQYLEAQARIGNYTSGRQKDPFLVEKLGTIQSATYRATALVPMPREYGQRIAIGIADSEDAAVTIACMHALQMLGALKIPVYADPMEQQKYYEKMEKLGADAAKPGATPEPGETPSPPPFKLVSQDGQKRGRFRFYVSGEEKREDRLIRQQQSLSAGLSSKKISLQEELVFQRQNLSRDIWSLEPDTTDGYILVNPSQRAVENQSFIHTLSSPRVLDTFAKTRVLDYMERNGRSKESALQISTKDGRSGVSIYVCSISIPLPVQFGERTAIGEAYAINEAELLAGMHAELILDTLGIPLYDHTVYQRRHGETARRMGRAAPLGHNEWAAFDTKSPPPLRKEKEDSMMWVRHQKQKLQKSEAPITTSTATATSSQTDSPSLFSKMVPLTRKQIDPMVRQRMNHYMARYERRVVDMEHMVTGNLKEHRCLLNIPVPEEYGKRTAVGKAPTKKEAILCCLMHAERIIDALGLQLFSAAHLQRRHVLFCREDGRYAPGPRDAPRPPDTPSPLGFCVDDMVAPLYPEPPEGNDQLSPEGSTPLLTRQQWSRYIDQVCSYLQRSREQRKLVAFEAGQWPTQEAEIIELQAAEIIETQRVDSYSKEKLKEICEAANMPCPDPAAWRWMNAGKKPPRKFYVLQSVEGTPYRAHGIASNPEGAILKAAMHYAAIVKLLHREMTNIAGRRVDSFFQPALSSSGETRVPAFESNRQRDSWNTSTQNIPTDSDLYDCRTQSYRKKAKPLLCQMFCLMQRLEPLVETLKEKRGPGGGPVQSYLVEMEDGDGTKLFGRGQNASSASLALSVAYNDLFKQLGEKKLSFATLGQVVKKFPALDAASCFLVRISPKVEHSVPEIMNSCGGGCKNDVFTSSSDSWEETEGVAETEGEQRGTPLLDQSTVISQCLSRWLNNSHNEEVQVSSSSAEAPSESQSPTLLPVPMPSVLSFNLSDLLQGATKAQGIEEGNGFSQLITDVCQRCPNGKKVVVVSGSSWLSSLRFEEVMHCAKTSQEQMQLCAFELLRSATGQTPTVGKKKEEGGNNTGDFLESSVPCLFVSIVDLFSALVSQSSLALTTSSDILTALRFHVSHIVLENAELLLTKALSPSQCTELLMSLKLWLGNDGSSSSPKQVVEGKFSTNQKQYTRRLIFLSSPTHHCRVDQQLGKSPEGLHHPTVEAAIRYLSSTLTKSNKVGQQNKEERTGIVETKPNNSSAWCKVKFLPPSQGEGKEGSAQEINTWNRHLDTICKQLHDQIQKNKKVVTAAHPSFLLFLPTWSTVLQFAKQLKERREWEEVFHIIPVLQDDGAGHCQESVNNIDVDLGMLSDEGQQKIENKNSHDDSISIKVYVVIHSTTLDEGSLIMQKLRFQPSSASSSSSSALFKKRSAAAGADVSKSSSFIMMDSCLESVNDIGTATKPAGGPPRIRLAKFETLWQRRTRYHQVVKMNRSISKEVGNGEDCVCCYPFSQDDFRRKFSPKLFRGGTGGTTKISQEEEGGEEESEEENFFKELRVPFSHQSLMSWQRILAEKWVQFGFVERRKMKTSLLASSPSSTPLNNQQHVDSTSNLSNSSIDAEFWQSTAFGERCLSFQNDETILSPPLSLTDIKALLASRVLECLDTLLTAMAIVRVGSCYKKTEVVGGIDSREHHLHQLISIYRGYAQRLFSSQQQFDEKVVEQEVKGKEEGDDQKKVGSLTLEVPTNSAPAAALPVQKPSRASVKDISIDKSEDPLRYLDAHGIDREKFDEVTEIKKKIHLLLIWNGLVSPESALHFSCCANTATATEPSGGADQSQASFLKILFDDRKGEKKNVGSRKISHQSCFIDRSIYSLLSGHASMMQLVLCFWRSNPLSYFIQDSSDAQLKSPNLQWNEQNEIMPSFSPQVEEPVSDGAKIGLEGENVIPSPLMLRFESSATKQQLKQSKGEEAGHGVINSGNSAQEVKLEMEKNGNRGKEIEGSKNENENEPLPAIKRFIRVHPLALFFSTSPEQLQFMSDTNLALIHGSLPVATSTGSGISTLYLVHGEFWANLRQHRIALNPRLRNVILSLLDSRTEYLLSYRETDKEMVSTYRRPKVTLVRPEELGLEMVELPK